MRRAASQHLCSDTADGGDPANLEAIPAEVVEPFIKTGIEQPAKLAGFQIGTANIWPLMKIAWPSTS
jgi:hypothetical protein